LNLDVWGISVYVVSKFSFTLLQRLFLLPLLSGWKPSGSSGCRVWIQRGGDSWHMLFVFEIERAFLRNGSWRHCPWRGDGFTHGKEIDVQVFGILQSRIKERYE